MVLSTASAQTPVFNPAQWDGPRSGPPMQSGKKIVFLAYDLQNGGVTSLFRNFENATRQLGWQIRLLDGGGQQEKLRARFAEAISERPDAIVLGGFQVDADLSNLCAQARRSNIVLIGWHASASPGPTTELFDNIASSSDEVAFVAANFVIQNTTGDVGVVIINDGRFAVANAKLRHMQDVLSRCKRCQVLSVEDVPISDARNKIPALVRSLNERYGKRWTHTLAINDIYFDEMNFPLMAAGRSDIQNISAGDGSNKAIARIRGGKSQQAATVAEPLGVQGWQLADELNRAFAGRPPSNYVSKPVLLTTESLRFFEGGGEGERSYRDTYSAIWNGKSVR
jgi:ribose transport system substrate-binding protein